MDTIVTHSCGHQHSHALFATFAVEIEAKAHRLARGQCPACREAEKAQGAQADAAVVVGLALPPLVGSDKQVAWASSIRAKRIATLIKAGRDATPLAARIDARWWIDRRDALDADLLAATAGAEA